MTINRNLLRHAVFLACGEQLEGEDLERLAHLLGVPEEILPHLVRDRGGLRSHPAITAALEDQSRRAPASPMTFRPPAAVDAVRLAAVQADVKAALKALIDRDLADQEGRQRVDDALFELVKLQPAPNADASLRVRR